MSRPHDVQSDQLAAVREQLLAQHRVAAAHVVEQLARLAAERAHDADAGERLADAAVDLLGVLADRAVDRPDAPRERRSSSASTPGMIASAVSASRQFSVSSTATAMTSRMTDSAGETIAICNRPVVVSTSPVSRERMPPVFMSHSFGSGRCSSRSNSDRRSDSITRTLSSRWR